MRATSSSSPSSSPPLWPALRRSTGWSIPRRSPISPRLLGAGLLGFVGNWLAALIRLGAGRALDSPALIADGNHAKADAYVSLAVVASALAVSSG